MQKFFNSKNAFFWLFLIVFSFSLEISALYYQYALGFEPCVICIQIRLLLALVIVLSIVGLLLKKLAAARFILNAGILGAAVVLLDKSWILVKTERGMMMGSCSFNAGLPDWFPIDKLIPYLFEVRAACGVTPDIAFGITMSESMMAVSAFLIIVPALSIVQQLFVAKR